MSHFQSVMREGLRRPDCAEVEDVGPCPVLETPDRRASLKEGQEVFMVMQNEIAVAMVSCPLFRQRFLFLFGCNTKPWSCSEMK